MKQKSPCEDFKDEFFMSLNATRRTRYGLIVRLSQGIASSLVVLFLASPASAFITETSYYTRASCIKESGQCRMACGKELRDEALICASWDFPLNSWVRVRNIRNGREVLLQVCDRGPNRKLYRKGRKLDVSFAAAQKLGFVKKGVALVEVKRVRGIHGK